METLRNFLDMVDQAGWMVVARLAPWLTSVLLTWLVAWLILRRIRALKQRLLHAPVAALGDAAQAGMHAAAAAAGVVAQIAGQAGRALQANALPVAERAGQVVVDGAVAGANMAAPHVQAASAAAIDAARVGADRATTAVAGAGPVIADAASSVLGVAAIGARAVGMLAKVKADELLEYAKAEQAKRDEKRTTKDRS